MPILVRIRALDPELFTLEDNARNEAYLTLLYTKNSAYIFFIIKLCFKSDLGHGTVEQIRGVDFKTYFILIF